MTSLAEVLLGAIGGVPRRCEDSVSTSERPRGLSLSLFLSQSQTENDDVFAAFADPKNKSGIFSSALSNDRDLMH